jgi:hypothetical protein
VSAKKTVRLSHWKLEEDRAHRALHTREWWNGQEWRPARALPRTQKEARAYRSAHDRLGEILHAMIGGSDRTRLKKAARFRQSANALGKRDERKDGPDGSSEAWKTLVEKFTEAHLLTAPLSAQLLKDCAEELRRGTYKTRTGKPWTREGVKSFLRRRRPRL